MILCVKRDVSNGGETGKYCFYNVCIACHRFGDDGNDANGDQGVNGTKTLGHLLTLFVLCPLSEPCAIFDVTRTVSNK